MIVCCTNKMGPNKQCTVFHKPLSLVRVHFLSQTQRLGILLAVHHGASCRVKSYANNGYHMSDRRKRGQKQCDKTNCNFQLSSRVSSLGFPWDGTSCGKSRDKKNLFPVSLCPGTRVRAKIQGQNKFLFT